MLGSLLAWLFPRQASETETVYQLFEDERGRRGEINAAAAEDRARRAAAWDGMVAGLGRSRYWTRLGGPWISSSRPRGWSPPGDRD